MKTAALALFAASLLVACAQPSGTVSRNAVSGRDVAGARVLETAIAYTDCVGRIYLTLAEPGSSALSDYAASRAVCATQERSLKSALQASRQGTAADDFLRFDKTLFYSLRSQSA